MQEEKQFDLDALWHLVGLKPGPAPIDAVLDDSIKVEERIVTYIVVGEGIWLLAEPLDACQEDEFEAMTGFHQSNLRKLQKHGLAEYVYGMRDGSPLMPIPFTVRQLLDFNDRTMLVSERIARGEDTLAWIEEDLRSKNSDAAELARAILGIEETQQPAALDSTMLAYPDAPKAPPDDAGSPDNGTAKRWDDAALESLAKYRETHTGKDTAAKFNISVSRMNVLLNRRNSRKPTPMFQQLTRQ